MEAAANQQLLKLINRAVLVRRLCTHPGLSRADLAAVVGFTKSTVSTLVRELISEGWLIEHEVVATGDIGRRPTPLFIDPHRLVLLGVEVGVESVRVVATSLTGDIRAGTTVPYRAARTARACIACIAAALQKVAGQLSASQRVLGIGVGVPGGVDQSRNVLNFAPNLGWKDVPFGEMLRGKLNGTALAGIPLFIKNEADAAALGELEFNPALKADPLLYVSINQGLGAGVIVGGRVLNGSRGFAGEVGHTVLKVDGPLCSCGRRGCAEALIASGVVVDGQGDDVIRRSMARTQAELAAGNANTRASVATAGRYLGVLLHNLATAYDPACIVLGGDVIELGEPFLKPARDTLQNYAAAAGMPAPKVRVSCFGVNAVAVGAAALARHRLTQPALPQASNDPIEASNEVAAMPA